jgi:hypothetical protein
MILKELAMLSYIYLRVNFLGKDFVPETRMTSIEKSKNAKSILPLSNFAMVILVKLNNFFILKYFRGVCIIYDSLQAT